MIFRYHVNNKSNPTIHRTIIRLENKNNKIVKQSPDNSLFQSLNCLIIIIIIITVIVITIVILILLSLLGRLVSNVILHVINPFG